MNDPASHKASQGAVTPANDDRMLLRRYANEGSESAFTGVIDLVENPHLAREDQIIAIPTLIRKLPEPIKKIIGDLSNTDRVLVGLDIKPLECHERMGKENEQKEEAGGVVSAS